MNYQEVLYHAEIMENQNLDVNDVESASEATLRFTITEFSELKESVLSQPVYVRNLPWKIMAMPRAGQQPASHDRQGQGVGQQKSLGFFLQCNGESESTTWSCNAQADLRIIPQKEGCQMINRRIQHVFYSKENDWGFSHFLSWADITDPEKGFLKDDTIILEVWVSADAPHGVSWDSKKHTGFVGLKNQGATCYMNSLLQTLFFTNQLRKAVYQMPTESDDSVRSVALALQRVFYHLQFSDKPVGTKKLTKSFGWETLDSFMQHDVQELCRVLLDNMESKMKGTCVEGTIPKLFEGKMISFIRCKHVDCSSSRNEPFYDIQLNIKGKRNIHESFKDYVAVETLDGDNKYDAGDLGMQAAEKGITFEHFPPVLHLHLLRFQYDPSADTNVKINDRFEFPEHLNLDEYLKEKESTPATYTLHAVLVHSGDNHGGHYVVFINPKGDGKWCKFDDDVVSRCTKLEAVDHNFGGNDDDMGVKHCTNAYMLVYIRDSELQNVLQNVDESDIPEQLVERLQEEFRQEAQRRKERNEAHMYMNLNVYTEDNFIGHCGYDLFDMEKCQPKVFRIKKQAIVKDVITTVATHMNYPREAIRFWPIKPRNSSDDHQLLRPASLDYAKNSQRPVHELTEIGHGWSVFVELLKPDSGLKCLPPIGVRRDLIIIFFKLYDPLNKFLTYCGHSIVEVNIEAQDFLKLLNNMAGYPEGTELDVYVEYRTTLRKVDFSDESTYRTLTNLWLDGEIIVFQRICSSYANCEFPSVDDYYKDLSCRVEVTFCDKTIPNDAGFKLELSLKNTYDQMAETVAQHLGTDPYLLQFFRNQSYREGPGNPLKCNFDGTLKDILIAVKQRTPKKIYYQHLTIRVNELENKKQFTCVWINNKLKEEKELVLYPNKNGTVQDLLDEARKLVELSEDGSGMLRCLEITSFRITSILPEDVLLDCLNASGNKTYRIEETPLDEVKIEGDEFLVPVAHFFKDPWQTFGVPFFIKLVNREPFSNVKERIQRKLDVPDKEFEKYHFAIVTSGRLNVLNEDNEYIVNKDDFHSSSQISNLCSAQMQPKPWLGLEHVNKAPKRSRYNYLEKAIKIHN